MVQPGTEVLKEPGQPAAIRWRVEQADGIRAGRLRAVVAGTEAGDRAALCELLNAEEIELLSECRHTEDTVRAVLKGRPDLLCLALAGDEVEPFRMFDRFSPAWMPLTIVSSHSDRNAMEAFEVPVLDYLPEPVDPGRFHAAIECARGVAGRLEALEFRPELARIAIGLDRFRRTGNTLAIKCGKRTLILRLHDVRWVEASGNYVRIHHARGAHLLRETITVMETRLPAFTFARVHRTAIANLDGIAEIHHRGRNDESVVLDTGEELPLGKTYRGRLRRVLARF